MTKKDWVWVKSVNSVREFVYPLTKDSFVLSLNYEDQKFSLKTDCNRFFGSFKLDERKVSFNKIGSTRMRCSGSQERVFVDQLALTQSYQLDKSENSIELIAEDDSRIILKAL